MNLCCKFFVLCLYCSSSYSYCKSFVLYSYCKIFIHCFQ
ncbi:unnamed protein product [Brugia timori]|uniref:Uncharacterized protein n=1 Tax=Brugia timori TaxID=42155 RepID=A0A3P7ZVG4_9BILA|nr:unnamed protein product [Brugia timori]